MNRKEKIAYVMQNVINAPEANIFTAEWMHGGRKIVFDCIHAIDKSRIGKPAAAPLDISVKRGMMFIDGAPALRIGHLHPEYIGANHRDDDAADFYEGAILARQENDGFYDI